MAQLYSIRDESINLLGLYSVAPQLLFIAFVFAELFSLMHIRTDITDFTRHFVKKYLLKNLNGQITWK